MSKLIITRPDRTKVEVEPIKPAFPCHYGEKCTCNKHKEKEDICPECGAKLVEKNSGVKCPDCWYWFCY